MNKNSQGTYKPTKASWNLLLGPILCVAIFLASLLSIVFAFDLGITAANIKLY